MTGLSLVDKETYKIDYGGALFLSNTLHSKVMFRFAGEAGTASAFSNSSGPQEGLHSPFAEHRNPGERIRRSVRFSTSPPQSNLSTVLTADDYNVDKSPIIFGAKAPTVDPDSEYEDIFGECSGDDSADSPANKPDSKDDMTGM